MFAPFKALPLKALLRPFHLPTVFPGHEDEESAYRRIVARNRRKSA
ncbi:hypothetical protein [Pseudogemmobacter sonorensis]